MFTDDKINVGQCQTSDHVSQSIIYMVNPLSSKMTIERLKGFRDLYPEDAEPKFASLNVAQEVARSFGFRHIDIPSLESLDLYRLKSGEELVSQTFSFTDKGGREVTMVPEATPSVVRMLTARKDLSRPVKWFSIPKIWRYEEPQSGRLREHIQFNADIFGPDTPEADAEIIGLAASILDNLELTDSYSIRVNDRKLMEGILRNMGVSDILAVFSVIDKFRKIDRVEFLAQLQQAGVRGDSAEKIATLMETTSKGSELLQKLQGIIQFDSNLKEITDRVAMTLDLISEYTKSDVHVDFSVVRGLSYYTGIVFEVFDSKGEFRSILGGGRYNNLSGLMSDQNIPAVGFGMGDVVLELLLKREGKWQTLEMPGSFYVCVASPEARKQALYVSSSIRRLGMVSSADISRRSLSNQMKNASTLGYSHAVIIGKKELDSGIVTLRDLVTGQQKELPVTELHKLIVET